MTKKCVAAIDQGTSSSRVLIISADGKVLGSHQKEHEQFYPAAGQVEHDPMEIWENVRDCLSKAIGDVNLKQKVNVVSIGITNQRETTIVWNKKTGKPYHRAIVWNDTRTGELATKLAKEGGADRFREKTGLPIASYFSATKLMYLLETVPKLREDAEKGEALFGTMDTWLIWNLTNGKVHATDVTNASRTLFMDLHKLKWDDEILKELNIPKAMLPQICPSSHIFGHVNAEHGDHHGHKAGRSTDHYSDYNNVPIGGVLGDQNAALFGQACYQPGDSKCTYGTGAFMLFNTGDKVMQSKHGLLTTVAYQLGAPQNGKPDGKPQGAVYALEGSVAYSGSVIQWLRDNLQVIDDAKESEALARSVPDNGGVYFVPAFSGLYAPYWRSDARGVITGLTAYNTKAHLMRAALEASAFQTVEVAHAMMKDTHHRMKFSNLRVDGGGATNQLSMQFLADVLDLPIVRPVITETTALGAAFVAGLAVGLWKDTEELTGLWKAGKTWQPTMEADKRQNLMANWHKAVDRSLNWVDEHTREVTDSSSSGGSGKSSRSGSKRKKSGGGAAKKSKADKANDRKKTDKEEKAKGKGAEKEGGKSGSSKASGEGHSKGVGKTKDDPVVHNCVDGYAAMTRATPIPVGGAAVGALDVPFPTPLAIAAVLHRAATQVRQRYHGFGALVKGSMVLPVVRTFSKLLRGRRW